MAWQPRPDRPQEISADPQRSQLRAYEIAGVPERHEPDTGEIRYSYLFDLLNEIGYGGRVGCEYRPAGNTMDGLGWFRSRSGRLENLANIGFIGLGIMGSPMSRNLIKAGHRLVVYDILAESVKSVMSAGASVGSSCADVASQSDVIITMLPDGPQVEEAVLGPGGVLEGARAGSTAVDMSSINPLVAQKVGAACGAKGVAFLDAAVSPKPSTANWP